VKKTSGTPAQGDKQALNIRNEQPKKVPPTTEQLAMLAAALAHTGEDDSFHLVSRAADLWERTQAYLDFMYSEAPLSEEQLARGAEFQALPKPRKYPVKRDEFAQLMLPRLKGRTADLAAALKAYGAEKLRRERVRQGSSEEPTPEEVAKYYAEWKPMDQPTFSEASWEFFHWWKDYHRQQVSEVRRKAALSAKRRKAASKAKHPARPPVAQLQAALKQSGA